MKKMSKILKKDRKMLKEMVSSVWKKIKLLKQSYSFLGIKYIKHWLLYWFSIKCLLHSKLLRNHQWWELERLILSRNLKIKRKKQTRNK